MVGRDARPAPERTTLKVFARAQRRPSLGSLIHVCTGTTGQSRSTEATWVYAFTLSEIKADDSSNSMGKQQFLTRLALGRSAFQDPEEANGLPEPNSQDAALTQACDQVPSGGYVQQYDAKGRPVNPATQARNAEMRRAQNNVLALVGVVESRELSEHHTEMKLRYIREARHVLLQEEHDRGEDLDLLANVVTPLLVRWTTCLLQRFLIGLYDADIPFSVVVGNEWQKLLSGGLKGVYAILLPGTVAQLAYTAARFCLDAVVSEPLNYISESIWKRKMRPRTRQRLDTIFRGVFIALIAATNIPLLPLCHYAAAQQLGLAPAWPLLPPLKSYLPWHSVSVHSFGWRPVVGVPLLRAFCSPAALMLIRLAITNDTDEADVPLAGDYTAFRYPAINEPSDMARRPTLHQDPMGWVLYHSYSLRVRILDWCGWHLVSAGRRSEHKLEQNRRLTIETDGSSTQHTHRSTSMSHLPPSFLASRIDKLLEQLMKLPLESVMLRAVAVSYLASPLPLTNIGLAAAPNLYVPFGGGLLKWLRSPSPATELVHYASKIGLCLALRISVDAAVSLSVAKLVCSHGRRYFDWGSRTHMGRISYAAQGSVRLS